MVHSDVCAVILRFGILNGMGSGERRELSPILGKFFRPEMTSGSFFWCKMRVSNSRMLSPWTEQFAWYSSPDGESLWRIYDGSKLCCDTQFIFIFTANYATRACTGLAINTHTSLKLRSSNFLTPLKLGKGWANCVCQNEVESLLLYIDFRHVSPFWNHRASNATRGLEALWLPLRHLGPNQLYTLTERRSAVWKIRCPLAIKVQR